MKHSNIAKLRLLPQLGFIFFTFFSFNLIAINQLDQNCENSFSSTEIEIISNFNDGKQNKPFQAIDSLSYFQKIKWRRIEDTFFEVLSEAQSGLSKTQIHKAYLEIVYVTAFNPDFAAQLTLAFSRSGLPITKLSLFIEMYKKVKNFVSYNINYTPDLIFAVAEYLNNNPSNQIDKKTVSYNELMLITDQVLNTYSMFKLKLSGRADIAPLLTRAFWIDSKNQTINSVISNYRQFTFNDLYNNEHAAYLTIVKAMGLSDTNIHAKILLNYQFIRKNESSYTDLYIDFIFANAQRNFEPPEVTYNIWQSWIRKNTLIRFDRKTLLALVIASYYDTEESD